MFKHPKLRIVTQTLKKNTSTKHIIFFGTYSFQYLNTKKYCLESLTKQALCYVECHLSNN